MMFVFEQYSVFAGAVATDSRQEVAPDSISCKGRKVTGVARSTAARKS
jgi:hypothetical protein